MKRKKADNGLREGNRPSINDDDVKKRQVVTFFMLPKRGNQTSFLRIFHCGFLENSFLLAAFVLCSHSLIFPVLSSYTFSLFSVFTCAFSSCSLFSLFQLCIFVPFTALTTNNDNYCSNWIEIEMRSKTTFRHKF